MKKLIIFNHLGQKELEFDVFMEGQDFCTSFPTPKCIWLGQIVIADLVKEAEANRRAIIEVVRSAQLTDGEEAIATEPFYIEERYPIPNEGEEVKEHEPETVSNQSSGDSGTGTSEQPESLEKLPKKHTGGQARKRSKRVRNSKAA